jgi:hypothetical protein
MKSLLFQVLELNFKFSDDHPAQTGQQVLQDQPALIVRQVQLDPQVQIDQPAQKSGQVIHREKEAEVAVYSAHI